MKKVLTLIICLSFTTFLLAQITYNSSGDYTYTVPTTGDLTVTMKGGNGIKNWFSSPWGGTGAELQSTFSVQAGDVLLLVVGGGATNLGAGGSGSALILTRGATSTLLMVAGGGGGGGQNQTGRGGNSADGTPGGGSHGGGSFDLAGGGGGGFNANGADGIGPGHPRPGGKMGTLTGGSDNGYGGYGFGSGGVGGYGGGGGGGYGGGNGGSLNQGGQGGTSYVETSGTNGFVGTSITRTDGTDGGANGGNGFITISGNATLPVELTYFKGEPTSEGNILTWQTASEKNNEGFEIQRAVGSGQSAVNSLDWQTIGFVQGYSTTQEVSDYSYTDKTPIAAINYYRLKQMDFDGQYEYSDIINITMEQFNNSTISIFPNPVKDELNIITNEPTHILIINATGQVLKEQTIQNKETINVSDLPNGIYFLKTAQTTKKFILQH